MSTTQDSGNNYGVMLQKLCDRSQVIKVSQEQTKKNLNTLSKAMNLKYGILEKIIQRKILKVEQ